MADIKVLSKLLFQNASKEHCQKKKPRVIKLFARNSGAGNGCANFTGAWKIAFFLQENPPCPQKFLVLGGGVFGVGVGGSADFIFMGARTFSDTNKRSLTTSISALQFCHGLVVGARGDEAVQRCGRMCMLCMSVGACAGMHVSASEGVAEANLVFTQLLITFGRDMMERSEDNPSPPAKTATDMRLFWCNLARPC